MPQLPATIEELQALRDSLIDPFTKAEERNDQAEIARLIALTDDIDLAINAIVIRRFSGLAESVAKIRVEVDAAITRARTWPFGGEQAKLAGERFFRDVIQDNDFKDKGPTAPAPEPTPISSHEVPKVSKEWAETYTSLWETMKVLPGWDRAVNRIARTIIANQQTYAAAVADTSVPWWFLAVLHAMECGLDFRRHLHNGDPLNARTVQIPAGRPPVGEPPFRWEVSATDAIIYERLDKVTDWSLQNVLFNWHRFNGINNEYKRRNIPTPYLWSGSQHYRKGKYVADRVFDPEAVSKQVGAAVILRELADLRAVTLVKDGKIASNPAAAGQHVESIVTPSTDKDFKHLAVELDYPGAISVGSDKSATNRRAARRIQEWLNIHGFVTPIDGDFGEATTEQLRRFQVRHGQSATGGLDQQTWVVLTGPLRRAFAKIDHGAHASIEDAVVAVARQHIKEAPQEIGGDNCGPWVRTYMQGVEGVDQKWCAGFVCFVVAQAVRDLGIKMPFKRQVGVDALVTDAKVASRFVGERDYSSVTELRSKVRPGSLFFVRTTATDWAHTGIILNMNELSFDTLEGNTGGDNGHDGADARQSNRNYSNKDFMRLA